MAAANGKGFAFQGIEGVDRVLDALGKRLGPQVMNGILKQSAQPMVKEAKRLVKKGRVRSSIGFIQGRGAKRGQLVYLGPRKSKGGRPAHLIEYGTGPRSRKNGGSTGSMPAKPFMRPAFDTQAGNVVAEIRKRVKTLLTSNFQGVKF